MSAAGARSAAPPAAPSGSRPPLSNTGVERTSGAIAGATELGVGWLAGTIRDAALQDVRRVLGRRLGLVVDQGFGSKWYGESARVGVDGSTIAWAPRGQGSETRAGEVSFTVPQSACDRLGWEGCADLVDELQAEFGVHWTRVDVNWDDQERSVGPMVPLEAFRDDQVRTRLQASRRSDRHRRGVGDAGLTVYLGSPTSEQQLRVYDKDAEQCVPEGTYGIRWELQARGDRAAELVREVVLGKSPGEAFATVLVSLVDFREREGRAHAERAPRAGWWAAIVGRVQGARRAGKRVVDSLARRREHLERQWGPSMAMLVVSKGGEVGWLHELIRRARARVKPEQWQLVDAQLERDRLAEQERSQLVARLRRSAVVA